jgi:hypothetical protein
MGNLFIKTRIPDGSRLSLTVTEADGTPPGSFVAGARLLVDSGNEEIWDDSQIHPGPKSKTLRSPEQYVWRIRIEFTGKQVQSAVVHAEVVKPDGSVLGSTFDFTAAGRNGDDPVRATLIATTKAS